MKVVKNRQTHVSGKVSVLIPMGNEEINVVGCLDSIINQKGLTILRLLF
jgi:glycosyltransferase involved in cell wall biosynthesis